MEDTTPFITSAERPLRFHRWMLSLEKSAAEAFPRFARDTTSDSGYAAPWRVLESALICGWLLEHQQHGSAMEPLRAVYARALPLYDTSPSTYFLDEFRLYLLYLHLFLGGNRARSSIAVGIDSVIADTLMLEAVLPMQRLSVQLAAVLAADPARVQAASQAVLDGATSDMYQSPAPAVVKALAAGREIDVTKIVAAVEKTWNSRAVNSGIGTIRPDGRVTLDFDARPKRAPEHGFFWPWATDCLLVAHLTRAGRPLPTGAAAGHWLLLGRQHT